MSTYVNLLGHYDMNKHDHLVVKVIDIRFDRVYMEFEPDNIISNCIYSFDLEYGGQYEPLVIMGNSVTFVPLGKTNMDELKDVKAGDKMYFISKFPLHGEYDSGRPFKYAEL